MKTIIVVSIMLSVSVKKVKWHGLCAPNVRRVKTFPEHFDLDTLKWPFCLLFTLADDVSDRSADKLTEWSEAFCWSLLKRNVTKPCVVFHDVLATNDDYNTFVFDLYLFVSKKCSDFVSAIPTDLMAANQTSVASWLKLVSQQVTIVVVLGFYECNLNTVRLLHSLHYADVSLVVYSLDIQAKNDLMIKDNGLACDSFVITKQFEDQCSKLEEPAVSSSGNTNYVPLQVSESSVGTEAKQIFDSLTEDLQSFVKQCAILRDRNLFVKVIKCLWKFIYGAEAQNPNKARQLYATIGTLIEKGILKHFLGSYFLCNSMRAYVLDHWKNSTPHFELKVLNQNLLQAYLEKYKTWLSVPQADAYFHQFFIRHLLQAGNKNTQRLFLSFAFNLFLAGGLSEAVNLSTNLEWLLQRLAFGLHHQLLFDLKFVLPAKEEEKDSLYSLLRIMEIVLVHLSHSNPHQAVAEQQQALTAYIVSSFCEKTNSASILSKLFDCLPQVVSNNEHDFWFLPLHNSLTPKLLLVSSFLNLLPLDSVCLYCDVKYVLLGLKNEMVLIERQTLNIRKSIKLSEEVCSCFDAILATRVNRHEFNVISRKCELLKLNFTSGQSEFTRESFYEEESEIVQWCVIYRKTLLVTIHRNASLNVWDTESYQHMASVNVAPSEQGVAPDAAQLFISYAFMDLECIRLCILLNYDTDPFCVLFDYDADSSDLSRVSNVPLASKVVHGSISSSGEILVCLTADGSADLYSIGFNHPSFPFRFR